MRLSPDSLQKSTNVSLQGFPSSQPQQWMSKPWYLVLLLCMLPGCSIGKLDTQTATQEIQSRFKLNNSSIIITVGRVSEHCILYTENGVEHERGIKPEQDIDTVVGLKAGYLTVTRDGGDFWKISLTEKGKTAHDSSWSDPTPNTSNGCDYQDYGFVVARPELVGVTGISGDRNMARVDYQYKWVPTELGQALRKNGAIYSQLTDMQRILLSVSSHDSYNVKIPRPVPAEGQLQTDTAIFQKRGGRWRAMVLDGRDD